MKKQFNTLKFKRNTGDKLYRSGMYSIIKQSSPPPQMELFDAPSREFCSINRNITNTSLQSLAFMNDEMYLEMSRLMGTCLLKEFKGNWLELIEARIVYGLPLINGRKTNRVKLNNWFKLTNNNLSRFNQNIDDTKNFLIYGGKAIDNNVIIRKSETLTFARSTALDLDETINQH